MQVRSGRLGLAVVAALGAVAFGVPAVGAAAPLKSVPPVTSTPVPSGASVPLPSVGFVVTCAFSHRSDDDPIVHPGMAGMSHSHDFFGNRSTTADSTPASLAKASTSCDRRTDKSAYWLPSLSGGRWASPLRAYYSAGVLAPSSIVPMPTGLQLIGGDAHAVDGSTGSVDVVAFSCGRAVNESGWVPTPPTCPGPLSVRITFPQCWDGRTLAAPGNAVAPVAGRCPSGFPVALPRLQLVATTVGPVSAGAFRTSAGGPLRMHADFVNAWNASALGRLVAVCNRGERSSNRELKECHVRGSGPRAAGGPDVKETNY